MVKSQVAKFNQMLLPTLEALKSLGGSANIEELDNKTIEIMKLSSKMCNVPHKENATLTEVKYRLAWARTYLKKYGLINNSSRGVWASTENLNSDISKYNADKIVTKVRGMSLTKPKDEDLEDDELENDGVDLPEEVMNWRGKLREVLLQMPPDAFERLTLRVLRESGFTQVEVTGQSGDRGIDGKGIIRLNGIMSFHMLFQCKRYKGSVTPSEIRDFRGAMQGRGDKGLFITTGTFTAEARREAIRDGVPALDLIDGDALIEKLKDLELGVNKKIITDYVVDYNWFSKL